MAPSKGEKMRVLFPPKAEAVFDEILGKYNLQETDQQISKKHDQGQETNKKVLMDFTRTMAKNIIPEQKLVEFLQKYLGLTQEITGQIAGDIKNKLIPMLKLYPEASFNDPVLREKIAEEVFGPDDSQILNQEGSFQEQLLNKVRAGRPNPIKQEKPVPPPAYPKERPILDVDKNAEQMTREGKNVITQERDKFPKNNPVNPPPQAPIRRDDRYKEPLE